LVKRKKKRENIWEDIEEFTINLLLAPFRDPVWKTKEEKAKEEFNFQKLTPGEKKVIELIQQKLAKFGFWCNFRITYIATKDIFESKKDAAIALIGSVLKNFSTEDLNGFSLYPLGITKPKMSPERIFHIKRREYRFFKIYRVPSDKSFILNSEELATLFHPPMEFVPPSGIERVPVRELPPSPEIPFTI
jgi:hypothetical protein